MTNDLDLIPAPSRENMRRLADALNELGARVLDPGGEGTSIDALMLPRAEVPLGDLRIPFAGRDDLISMKRASGRPVDLGDVAALTEPSAP